MKIKINSSKMVHFKFFQQLVLLCPVVEAVKDVPGSSDYRHLNNVLSCLISRVSGHPLAQNERCLHMFLTEPIIDKNYVPGKVRTT